MLNGQEQRIACPSHILGIGVRIRGWTGKVIRGTVQSIASRFKWRIFADRGVWSRFKINGGLEIVME